MTGEHSGAGQRNRAVETESGVGGLALFLVITLIALAFAVAMAAAIGDYNIGPKRTADPTLFLHFGKSLKDDLLAHLPHHSLGGR